MYLRIDITLKDDANITINEMAEYVESKLGGKRKIETELLVRGEEAIESVDVY